MRAQDTNEGPNPSGLCQCGCGQPTPIAKKSDMRRGSVKGKPQRFLPRHDKRRFHPTAYVVDAKTGCWVWQGTKAGAGYGQICMDGVSEPVHRWFYRQHKGEIPDGLHIDHLCRNRLCVNPNHLEAVTAATNVRRSSGTILTADQVREMRALGASLTIRDLATRFHVQEDTVRGILKGERWGDVV